MSGNSFCIHGTHVQRSGGPFCYRIIHVRSDVLAEQSSLHPIIVWSLIKIWDENNYFTFLDHIGSDGVISFQQLSALGKRYFRDMLNQ